MIFTEVIEPSSGIVQYVLIGLAFILGIVIPTVISLFTKRNFDKFFAKKEQTEKEQKEMADKVKEYESAQEREQRKTDMEEIVGLAIAPLKQDLETIIKSDLELIKKGTQAGLRHDLCLMADEWLQKGYCPRDRKVDFEQIYTQYHQLGKNGVMDTTYQAILDLPEKPKVVRIKKPVTQSKKIDVNKDEK